jgi:hypothetical protein
LFIFLAFFHLLIDGETCLNCDSMNAEEAMRKIRTAPQDKDRKRSAGDRGRQRSAPCESAHGSYAIKADDIPSITHTPIYRMTWIYWRDLLHQFSLKLRHFGHRGNATIGNDKIVYINLRTSQWWIEQKSNGGRQTSVRDWGVESLRTYLDEHARSCSFCRR